MRLLRFNAHGELSLTKDLVRDIPPYAILSHTWGEDSDEVTFKDLENKLYMDKPGYVKIKFCRKQAEKDGLEHFWVDTCCIDKVNNTELSEAIISMFHWYCNADVCYVYLSDVAVYTDDNTERSWKPAFRKSRWFKRGWTLQELIAPGSVKFFSREGELLGDKKTLKQEIHDITGPLIAALCGAPLSDFSINERLRWAEKRETKRKEDSAYCLLGIFNVFMPLMYGEGENAFTRLKDEIYKLSRNQLDEATKKSLDDLQITDPGEDIKRIELSKDRLLEDCYKWILQDSSFLAWYSTDTTPLLWISGDPGKGKTMLMIALVRKLLDSARRTSSAVTFFFCQNTDIRLNHATSILRGLIWKLAYDQPQLAKHILERYKSGKQLINNPNAVISLFSILSAMLDDHPKTLLLIDALDECNPGIERDQLLDLIKEHAVSSSKVKWLLSSRNSPEIKRSLQSESRILNLELNYENISLAVCTFIAQKTNELAVTMKYNQALKKKIEETLMDKANSTFLWVALACKKLRSVRPGKALITLENLPPGLPELYARMMEQVMQAEDEEDKEICICILRAACLAFRPLSIEELITTADLPSKLLEKNDLDSLIDDCGSFIILRQHVLYFVHQSAKDYLINNGASRLFAADFHTDHGLVMNSSLDAMSKTLKRDMCNLRHPSASPSKGLVHTSLQAIGYACSFWVDHLIKYLNESTDRSRYKGLFKDRGLIHKFLVAHLLHWFEALSLFGEVDKGILGLHSLERIMGDALERCPDAIFSNHKSFIRDAIRVFRQCRPAVEEAPLQVYSCALIFSPKNSLVRQNFKHEAPHWISPLPRIRIDWSLCLQTLEGHVGYINSVRFSPDGRQLASASSDRTVRLWDTATGAPLHTLKGHTGDINSMRFSPDGRQLVSGSDDRTVRLWDTARGGPLHVLEGHTGWVYSVTFSPDGRQLASGSGDCTVRLWDAATGAQIHALEGHMGYIKSVRFSPDGQQLALGCDDRTVRLWDAATGAQLRTLEGHTGWVNSVRFSPDGRRLASGSGDRTVRLWDAATWALLYTLEGHTGNIYSVVFSPDGRQLASGSGDCTVQLWDAATGALLHMLEGHTACVYSVRFSPDGRQLASGSSDDTVRLWEAATGAPLHTLEGHVGYIKSVRFSPDGRQLVSGSDDRTVRLWDTARRGPLHVLEGHTGWVYSVRFSPNGRQLASGSGDCTVRLWDTATGAPLKTLEGHTGYVNSVRFSPDGQQLASGSSDRTVRLWDAATGAPLHTLEGHTGKVKSVRFSPDGRQLTSRSDDRTLWVWDAATGALLHTFESHIRSIFYSSDGLKITTDPRILKVWQSEPDNDSQKWGLSIRSKKWVTWEGDAVLWLPPDYRPSRFTAKENCIAVGSRSGLVYILNFRADKLPH